ncbi:hypothetical protein [Arthrobacter sp. D2-10]
MSENIAARAIADMQIAADRKLAWRIRRLKIACTVLSLACVALSVTILQPLLPSITAEAPVSPAPSPSYTPPAGNALQAALTVKRIPLDSTENVIMYARVQVDHMQDVESTVLHWYFLYEDDPGESRSVSLDSRTYFASEGDPSGRLWSKEGGPYPIMSLSNFCVATAIEDSCANLINAPYPNPAMVAVAVADEKNIYIIGSAVIPEPAESCESVLGAICNP